MRRMTTLASFALIATACATDTAPIFAAAKIRIAESATAVNRGDSLRLSAQVFTNADSLVADAPVTWSSESPAIASVNANGVVHGMNIGSSLIIARSGAAQSQISITVHDPDERIAALIVVSASPPVVLAGTTTQLTARVYNRWHEQISAPSITWISSRAAVATVSATGLMSATGAGLTSIVASSGAVRDSARVEVADGSRLSIMGAQTLVPGSLTQFRLAVAGTSGTLVDVPAAAWTSSDASVVALDANGQAVVGKIGSATIFATAATGSVSLVVTVSALPGRIIYIANGHRVMSLAIDGSAPVELQIRNIASPQNAMISPDGKHLALECPGACSVDLTSSPYTATTLGTGVEPSWSADGSTLAERQGYARIDILNAAGGLLTSVSPMRYAHRPRLSPDAASVIFECDYNEPYGDLIDLCVMGTHGVGSTLLVSNATNVAWSPDGLMMSFDAGDAVCTSWVDQPECVRVFPHALGGAESAWSPDGKHLVVSTGTELWLMDRNGANAARLLPRGASEDQITSPSWGKAEQRP
jgi:hypothetical protein